MGAIRWDVGLVWLVGVIEEFLKHLLRRTIHGPLMFAPPFAIGVSAASEAHAMDMKVVVVVQSVETRETGTVQYITVKVFVRETILCPPIPRAVSDGSRWGMW